MQKIRLPLKASLESISYYIMVIYMGLQVALQSTKQIIPCFSFDPRQVEYSQNPYKGNNALQFMIKSLIDLDKQLLSLIKSSSDNNRQCKLYIFYGEQEIKFNN
jgi:hypothetical protein